MDGSGYHDTSKSQQNAPVSLTSAANSGKSVAYPFMPGRGIRILRFELRQFCHSPLPQNYHSWTSWYDGLDFWKADKLSLSSPQPKH
ncbi:hypothetical protein GB937_006507 [Aspergillus fischeri]|nr:hypothetical protein GB937_006507 [Aspergillus fischeri]